MLRVLIVGSGDLGTAVGEELVRAGARVHGVRRSEFVPPAGIVPIRADVLEPSSLQAMPTDIDVLIYSVAADDGSEAAYEAAYVRGLENVLHRTSAGSVRRILFVSSTAVYGQTEGEWVDEESRTEPRHYTGKRLLEGEALVTNSGRESAALRVAGIYGPGREKLIRDVETGQAQRSASVVWSNRVHRDDCARAIAHLAAVPSLENRYAIVDCEPVDLGVVMDWLADTLAVERPTTRAAYPPQGGRRGRTNKRVSNARLLRTGFEFRYPTFREGYTEVLARRRRD